MTIAINWFVINNADVILGVMLGVYVALTWGRDKTSNQAKEGRK